MSSNIQSVIDLHNKAIDILTARHSTLLKLQGAQEKIAAWRKGGIRYASLEQLLWDEKVLTRYIGFLTRAYARLAGQVCSEAASGSPVAPDDSRSSTEDVQRWKTFRHKNVMVRNTGTGLINEAYPHVEVWNYVPKSTGPALAYDNEGKVTPELSHPMFLERPLMRISLRYDYTTGNPHNYDDTETSQPINEEL